MRKSLLFILSTLSAALGAQTLSVPTIPSAGVTFSMTIKSDTVAHPSQGNWDFSNVTTDATGTVEFESISSTNYSNNYPNATHVKYEDGSKFFLGFDSNEYTFHGEITVITTSYQTPLVLHTYPFATGDTHSDSETDISFTCSGCPPAMERDDSVYTESLSSGTLTMPDGTVHNTATLVYTTRTWNDGQIGSATCNLFMEQWHWWVSGYPMPVAQTVELSTTGPCPPNVGYRESKFLVGNPFNIDENAQNVLELYPNPAKRVLTVGQLSSGEHNFEIRDITGRLALNGTLSETENTIDISSLNTGMYFMVIDGVKQHVMKFVKE